MTRVEKTLVFGGLGFARVCKKCCYSGAIFYDSFMLVCCSYEDRFGWASSSMASMNFAIPDDGFVGISTLDSR